MINEKETDENVGLGENLKSVGQALVGEIERIGGILTGDPVTRAEGEFNVETGIGRQETNKNLIAADDREEAKLHENK